MTNLSRLKTLTDGITQLIIDTFGEVLEENELLREQVDGMRNGAADNRKKLTKSEVKQIRNLKRTSSMTQKDLADAYDVNPATISRIIRGQYHA